MTKHFRALLQEARALARAAGVSVRVQRKTRSHRHLVLTGPGGRRRCTVSCSPRDTDTALINARKDLARLIEEIR